MLHPDFWKSWWQVFEFIIFKMFTLVERLAYFLSFADFWELTLELRSRHSFINCMHCRANFLFSSYLRRWFHGDHPCEEESGRFVVYAGSAKWLDNMSCGWIVFIAEWGRIWKVRSWGFVRDPPANNSSCGKLISQNRLQVKQPSCFNEPWCQHYFI